MRSTLAVVFAPVTVGYPKTMLGYHAGGRAAVAAAATKAVAAAAPPPLHLHASQHRQLSQRGRRALQVCIDDNSHMRIIKHAAPCTAPRSRKSYVWLKPGELCVTLHSNVGAESLQIGPIPSYPMSV